MENSEISAKKDRKPITRKTSTLTLEEALQILQQAVLEVTKAGMAAKVAPIFSHGGKQVAIILPGCEIVEGFIVQEGKAAVAQEPVEQPKEVTSDAPATD